MTEPAPNTELRPGDNPRAFSLRLTLVSITCLAVALGLIWHWPGIVPIVAAGLTIALARMWSMMRVARAENLADGWKGWGLSFLASLGVAVLAGTTASGAFVAVCFPLAASQFNYPQDASVPILASGSWVIGGISGAIIAAIVLDQMWLKPLADRMPNQPLPTLKERTRSLFRVGIPPLAAVTTGGLCSLFPAAIAVMWSPKQPLLALAAFLACVAAFIGGGWLLIMASASGGGGVPK